VSYRPGPFFSAMEAKGAYNNQRFQLEVRL